MRNLKRVLSLVLASIMLVGMMVVGASAVDTYNDFNDKDEIVNKDAVSLLVTLNVINGKEDGSHFDPTGNVTRAEMAKMISVILNRGADINSQYATLNNGLTDVANNWAVGHINYCYSLDIIAGRGDGKFDPTANVTAVEAAKMLLSAAGYDASIEGMVGPNWDTNTAGLASRLGIFDNFEKDITLSLNRDDAALLIYNFLDIEMIQSYENGYAIAFADSRTVLSFAYGVIKVQGVVVANEWATVNSPDGDDALRAGMTTIWNGDGIFSTTTNTQTNGGNDGLTAAERALRTGTFKVSTPEDYLGKSVTIYIRKTTILADSAVYGQPVLTDDNIVVETGAQVKEGSRTTAGTLLKLLSDNNLTLNAGTRTEKGTLYFHNYDEYTTDSQFFTGSGKDELNSLYNAKGATLTIIDNNGDGVVDFVLSKEKTLSQVSAYSTKNESLNLRGVKGSLDFKEVVNVDDVEKDDIVFFVQYGGRTYVEQPETVTGEMELFNVKGNEKYMRVEGEKYEEDDLVVAENTDATKFLVAECDTDDGVNFDTTYEFYLDDYNNVTAFREIEGAAAKYALVLNSAFSTNGLTTTAQLRLLLSDGTTDLYDLNWSGSVRNLRNWLRDNKVIADMSDNNLGGDNITNAADWDDTNAEIMLKLLLGTDDGRYADTDQYPPVGQFKGNVVKYSLGDDNRVTITLPELEVGYIVTQGTPVTAEPTATPDYKHDILRSDLSKGDVDLFTTGKTWDTTTNAVATHNDEFGIDADTIIFYYDVDGSAVRIGYDEMARIVKAAPTEVSVSVIAKPGKNSDVAAVVLLYTEGMKFGTDNYVYVLKEFNVYGSETHFTVVDKEGNVSEVKAKNSASNTGDLKDNLRALSGAKQGDRDGLIMIMNDAGDGFVEFDDPAIFTTVGTEATRNVVYGIVRIESTRYINVYTDYDLRGDDDDEVVIKANSDYIRLPNRTNDITFDVDTLRVTDDKADTTALDDGMLVAIAYDPDGSNRTIIGVYVEEYYKMDPDQNDNDNEHDDSIVAPEFGTLDRVNQKVPLTAGEGIDLNEILDQLFDFFERNSDYDLVSYSYNNKNEEFDLVLRNNRTDGTENWTTETTWMSNYVGGASLVTNYGSGSGTTDDLPVGTVAGLGSDLYNFNNTNYPNNEYIPTEQHIIAVYELKNAVTGVRFEIKNSDGVVIYRDTYATLGGGWAVGSKHSFAQNISDNTRNLHAVVTGQTCTIVWDADGQPVNATDATDLDGSALPVGSYTWVITGDAANNYNVTLGTGSFTVR